MISKEEVHRIISKVNGDIYDILKEGGYRLTVDWSDGGPTIYFCGIYVWGHTENNDVIQKYDIETIIRMRITGGIADNFKRLERNL
jgi:hypothetical protein